MAALLACIGVTLVASAVALNSQWIGPRLFGILWIATVAEVFAFLTLVGLMTR